jgi:hypothetical protein
MRGRTWQDAKLTPHKPRRSPHEEDIARVHSSQSDTAKLTLRCAWEQYFPALPLPDASWFSEWLKWHPLNTCLLCFEHIVEAKDHLPTTEKCCKLVTKLLRDVRYSTE